MAGGHRIESFWVLLWDSSVHADVTALARTLGISKAGQDRWHCQPGALQDPPVKQTITPASQTQQGHLVIEAHFNKIPPAFFDYILAHTCIYTRAWIMLRWQQCSSWLPAQSLGQAVLILPSSLPVLLFPTGIHTSVYMYVREKRTGRKGPALGVLGLMTL